MSMQAPAYQLRSRWQALVSNTSHLPVQEAANRLGVSELSLLLRLPVEQVLLLDGGTNTLLNILSGNAQWITQACNDSVMHETHGCFEQLRITNNGRLGICSGLLSQRLFLTQWHHACLLQPTHTTENPSVHFFDDCGRSILKVSAKDSLAHSACRDLDNHFRAAEQRPDLLLKPAPINKRHPPRSARRLAADWQQLKQRHHFRGFLNRHHCDHLSALEAVSGQWSQPLPPEALETVFSMACRHQQRLMVRVNNRGIEQSHCGTPQRIQQSLDCFSILNDCFRLQVNTQTLASCWLSKRPCDKGARYLLEFFDRSAQLVMTLSGEEGEWQGLLYDLTRQLTGQTSTFSGPSTTQENAHA